MFIDERGHKVTEQELRETYQELTITGEFEGTFNQYINDCTGKKWNIKKNR